MAVTQQEQIADDGVVKQQTFNKMATRVGGPPKGAPPAMAKPGAPKGAPPGGGSRRGSKAAPALKGAKAGKASASAAAPA